MFKYVILNMNMDYDCFIKNFNIVKESYQIDGVPNIMFLYKEFVAINNSIKLAKKFVNNNKNKLKITEIANIIYLQIKGGNIVLYQLIIKGGLSCQEKMIKLKCIKFKTQVIEAEKEVAMRIQRK